MNATVALAKRCFLCYFRDRSSVVFSLMAVIIVVMLYLLFLGNTMVASYPDIPGMEGLIDAWVLAGILGIVPATTCAGSLTTMIEDRAVGRDRDLLVSPLKGWQVSLGYVLSTFAVGIAMSLITLVICVAYLAATGCPMTASGIALAAVLTVPSSLSAAIIMYTLCSFLRSMGAFSGLFAVVSVLIGFLCGIYMPMGTMPSAMQVVGTLVPASHFAALFRDSLASGALDSAFAGSSAEALADFRAELGFDLSLGGFEFDAATMLAYALAVTAVFFVVAAIRIRR